MTVQQTYEAGLDDLDDEIDDLSDLEDEDDWNPDAEDDEGFDLAGPLMWHGCLAPEGIMSGDGRMFSAGALTWRDLPLPLRVQEADTGAHNGAIVIATIDRIVRRGNKIMGEGRFVDTADADRIIGMVAERAYRGVSIDADSAELAEGAEEGAVEFAKGRICAATIVAIPAFAEAYVALGPLPDEGGEAPSGDGTFRDVSTEERDRLKRNGQAMPDGSYPIANCDDLRNAVQAIGRAKDPAAVKRHIKKRAASLECEGFELPEGWADDTDDFARGPGWVTNPRETRRIHAYWTQPGHKGYAKVRWGTPGDFTRLRRFLAKYISPEFLNRTAAQWHHDALGYWPGELGMPGNPPDTKENRRRAARHAHAVNLVSAAELAVTPSWYFDNPGFTEPVGLTVEGQHVYGHIATWQTCHVGIQNVCTTAPHSEHNYAYFRTGAVLTDKGRISVGQITMGTGHANLRKNPRAAADHYADTGTVVADVAAGEDDHGIWISGCLREGVTPQQVHALQAGAISGDWRNIGGSLELIAALVVNVPGFPIPRPALAAAGDEQLSLVAAGVVEDDITVADIADAVVAELARRDAVAAKLKSNRQIINEERVAALQASVGVLP